MRSDRKKVNCHDAKAYLPAGELELFVVLAHVHTHVCVCVLPVLEALSIHAQSRVPAKPRWQGLAPQVFYLLLNLFFLKYQGRICNRDQTNGSPSSSNPKGSYSD